MNSVDFNDRKKMGIASVAIVAVVIVIIVAAAGVGVYELTISHQTTANQLTTTPTISSTSSTASSSSYTASSSSTSFSSLASYATSSNSNACSNVTLSSGSLAGINIGNLFGNFTKMTMTASVLVNGSTDSFEVSYSVANSSMSSDGHLIYGVDLNGTVNSASGNISEAATFSYASNNGTVLSAVLNGQPSGFATAIISAYLVPFILQEELGCVYSSQFGASEIKAVNTTQITLGQTTVSVTNYVPTHLPFNYENNASGTVTGEELQIGAVSGTTFGPLITYLTLQITSPTGNMSYTFQVVSVTPAK
jgi:hypothetical protein